MAYQFYQIPKENTKLEKQSNYKNILQMPQKLSLTPIRKETSAVKTVAEPKLQTRLATKQILKVYLDKGNNTKWIEHSAAYALGITKVRAIVTEHPKYYQITDAKIEQLVSQREYEVQFVDLPPQKKQDINVYYTKNNEHYIETSAAYALGYIDVTAFYSSESLYGPLKQDQLQKIRETLNINPQSLELLESTRKSK